MKRCVRALVVAGFVMFGFSAAEAGDVTISTGRTTPVESATADGISPGNITITSAGSVTVGTGPAVTLNSSNAVINQGTIEVTADTGAIAVLFEAGNTGSLTNSGSIDALIVDGDGIATGANNVAFWVSGNGAFIGNISFTSTSTLKVGGTGSFGMLLDAEVQGAIGIAGDLTADGSSAVGFQSNALITGDLTIDSEGSIVATGDAAAAVLIAGGIDGAFTNNGTLSAIGSQTSVSYSSDLPRANFAVGIGASMTGGFQNVGAISGTSAGQGVVISSILGTTLADITLGLVDATDAPYGFVNQGSISASTARAGESVSGLAIEGATELGTDYTVLIEGGIKNSGTITSSRSADGTATAIDIGAFVSTPTILNTGSITGGATSTGTSEGYGILLRAGADVGSLDNSGTIGGSVTALDAKAYGIVDLSGTLLSITNSGAIYATASTTDEDTGTISTVAIDLSHAQSGITLSNSGSIVGDVFLGDHGDMVSIDAPSDEDTTSTWTGSIAFGAGDDTFTISGGGIFSGSTTKGSGTLAITVDDGEVALGSDDIIAATTIDLSSDATLTLVINPDLLTTPRLEASDSITFADGVTIEATLEEFVGNDYTAILARAPTIDASLASSDLIFENLPYLYAAEAEIVSGAQQELNLTFHLKTASELGFNANQSAFYGAVIDILSVADNLLAEPFLALSADEDFAKAYAALMPTTSQATLRASLLTVDDVERNLQDRAALFMKGDASFDAINAWWAGSGHAYALDSNALSQGIDGSVVSTTFGADRMFIPWLMIGAEITFAGATMFDNGSQSDVTHVDAAQGGVYGSIALGPLYVAASGGGGSTSNRTVRTYRMDDYTLHISDEWSGNFLNAAAEAGLNAEFRHLTIRPWVGLSWLNFSEEAHQERDGGLGFDLAYDAIEADIERAKAGLTLAYTWNYPQVQFTPELRAVWTQLLNDVPSELRGSFVDGSVPYILGAAPLAQDQISAGFGFMMHGKGLAVSLGYDAMFADGETSHSGKLEISTQF